ncbi:MAG: adenylyltransferase/cytidyltransferase family protein [Thermoplasmataceae archaeon]
MIRVMATGVFDILHPGHLHYLKESRKLGDELLVVIARDSTALRNGKTPIFRENIRLMMVSELKVVDRAILGHEGDIFQTVRENRPDIITLGHDQRFNPIDLEKKCRDMGCPTRVVRITRFEESEYRSSTDIRNKISEYIEGTI